LLKIHSIAVQPKTAAGDYSGGRHWKTAFLD